MREVIRIVADAAEADVKVGGVSQQVGVDAVGTVRVPERYVGGALEAARTVDIADRVERGRVANNVHGVVRHRRLGG